MGGTLGVYVINVRDKAEHMLPMRQMMRERERERERLKNDVK